MRRVLHLRATSFARWGKGKTPLMTRHRFAALVDSPSQIKRLDVLGDALDSASRAVQRPRALGQVLRGTSMGSPQHPGLVWIPSGLSLAAGLLAARPAMQPAARSMVIGALATTPLAAATGLAEASSIRRRGRRIASVHALLNTVGSGLQAVSLMRGAPGRLSRPWLYAGLATQMAAAMFGRHMAYHYRAELLAPVEPVIDVRDDHERAQDHERPRDRNKSPHVLS